MEIEESKGKWLTHLCFADDALLITSSKRQLRTMLEELIAEAGRAGLELHMGKTKTLSNEAGAAGGTLKVASGAVDILPRDGATDYLGKRLGMHDLHGVDIRNRLDKAWKAFFSNKDELCNRKISLRARLQLFNAVVTSSLLYGGAAWTMTTEREKHY